MNYLDEYYNNHDEEGRLLSRHGQVEYLTTMKYIRESMDGIESPDILEIGAGTVINAAQCEAALAAGATFIVSPGLSPAVAEICNARGIPYYPGCVTPTEIMAALELGITTVKFFPANIYGGLKALKALSAPFPQVKFIPTGGVDRSNIDEFLAFDKVAAIGGSFFVKESLEKMEADQ